jgi:hypothetical protein
MKNLSVSFFQSLKEQLTQQQEKKATWKEVALYCEKMKFDIFKNKDSRKVAMKVSEFKRSGIPSKVQLKFIQSDFKPQN